MSGEKEIFSKLNELLQLIDDHSKGKTIANPEKHHTKKSKRKAEYSDFSSILSGGEEDSPIPNKQKNKKYTKKNSNRSKSQQISKTVQPKKNETKNLPPQKKAKSKSPKKQSKNIKVINEEEEISEIANNDLSIHRDNLHKIFTECKNLDSIIEASLSPKPVKTRSNRIQQETIKRTPSHNSNQSSSASQKQNELSNTPSHSSKNPKSLNSQKDSQNSQEKNVSSATPSRASQNSKNKNISSTPSFNSSNNAIEQKETVDDRSVNSHNSKNVPPSENDLIYSTSSQVFVVEQATQTHLSSDHHSNSYESSKNSSNTQHLLDIDTNLHNENDDSNLIEEEEDITEEEDILSDDIEMKETTTRSISQKQNHTSKNKPMPQPQKKQIKQSPDSVSKNQQSKDEVIVFKEVQTRSIDLNEKDIKKVSDQNDAEESNISSEGSFFKNNQLSSNTSSSDLSIEAINSNSSDENAGQIIQSPIKMKTKKQPEFLDPIIEQTDSESEKKTQKKKQPPPQMVIPESQKSLNKSKNDVIDIIDVIDSENRDVILEILATSSSSDEQGKSKTPPNIVFSSSTTPKSAKTPEYLKPVFSSESESKLTTDTDKEKEEKESKPVPIYSNANDADEQNEDATEEEKARSKDLEYLRNKVIDNNLLDIIQSSESIDDDKDLIFLHTTSSSEGDY